MKSLIPHLNIKISKNAKMGRITDFVSTNLLDCDGFLSPFGFFSFTQFNCVNWDEFRLRVAEYSDVVDSICADGVMLYEDYRWTSEGLNPEGVVEYILSDSEFKQFNEIGEKNEI